ncbi:MAG: hypothetical protein PSY14_05330 [bacterium]|nr:hypothetical protein [bacterium]
MNNKSLNNTVYWHTLPRWKKVALLFLLNFCVFLPFKENPWSMTSGWKRCDVRTIYDKKTGVVEPGFCYRIPTPRIMPLAVRMIDASSRHVQNLTEQQKQASSSCGVFVNIGVNQPTPSGQAAFVSQKNPFFESSLCDEIGELMVAEASKMDEEVSQEWKEAGEKMMREKGWASDSAAQ